MGRPNRCVFVLVLAMSLISLGGAPTSAHDLGLHCGDTITSDTTLHADLVHCASQGIVIGADNITLDLNGHTISGDGASSNCTGPTVCDVGVNDSAGHDDVTVEGGTVRNFTEGVRAANVVGFELRGAAISRCQDFGAVITRSRGSVVEHNTFSRNGISGLLIVDAQHGRVSRNSVSRSHGIGIPMFGVNDSVISHNSFEGNDHGILGDASSRNVIAGNVVSHSGGSSIDFGDGATGNRIEYNRLTDNGDGIVGTNFNGNEISHNVVADTGTFGSPDTGGFGLILDGSGHNTVHSNIITGGRGPAVFVTSLDSPTPSRGNIVSANVVNSKLSSGIVINNGASGTLLLRNLAVGSGDDGIYVDAPATTLTRNTAILNHNLGIEAVRRVIDGGGNVARRNSNPLQCTGVVCAARHPRTSAGLAPGAS